jgi:P27 family predicted phage terminase small subunit
VALKIAAGVRSDRIPSNAVNAPTGLIAAPKWLDEFAREDFERLTASVARLNLLSPVDVELYVKHAVIYSRWRRAGDDINKDLTTEGAHGGEACKAAVGIQERSERLLLQIEAELGLSPVSRSRLRASEQATEDEFEKFKREHA